MRIIFIFILTMFCLEGISQVIFESSNLPIFIIETEFGIPDEPKVDANLKVINNDQGRNFLTDEPTDYNGKIGVERRGSTSQYIFPKTGFGFETRNEDDSNNNVSLLGMPKENDWVLHGPYSDKTLMRNAIAYQLAGEIMAYASRSRHIELIINGEYRGVYLLLEKIKRDKNRVNIKKNIDDITGGYIVKIDKFTGAEVGGWSSENKPEPGIFGQEIVFQYHYPDQGAISFAQEEYIQGFMEEFEDKLKSSMFKDSILGYRSIIDVESFIDFFIVNELTKNPDGYRLSTFLYKDRDSIDHRLKMGPVWDFNLALGNVNYCVTGSPVGWVLDHNNVCQEDFYQIPFWWKRLQQDTYFGEKLVDRWQMLRQTKYSDENIFAKVDSLEIILQESQERNFTKWPIMGEYIWPNNFVGSSYLSEVNELRSWLEKRLDWLDASIPQYSQVQFIPYEYTPAHLEFNPVTDHAVLNIYADLSKEVHINILSSSGKLYSSMVKHFDTGTQQVSIDTKYLPNGAYFLEFRMGEEYRESIKFIKN